MRDKIHSYLLASTGSSGNSQLTVTLVEMEVDGFQRVHAHEPEQVYYILEGSGVMSVDDEQCQVRAGDCVHFPPFARHGLHNTGQSVLRYLSAASPSFSQQECRQLWPLPALNAIQDETSQQDKF